MKLKQRLALATFCGFVFFVTKPLWDWDDPEWRPRHRRHHRLVHRIDYQFLPDRETEGFLHSKLHGPDFKQKIQEAEEKFGSVAQNVPADKNAEGHKPSSKSIASSTTSKTTSVKTTAKSSSVPEKKIIEEVKISDSIKNFHAELQGLKDDLPQAALKADAEPRVESEAKAAPAAVAAAVAAPIAVEAAPIAVAAAPIAVVAAPIAVVAAPIAVVEAPAKPNFPNVKLDVVVTEEQIKKEMDRIKVSEAGKPAGKSNPWEVARNWVRPRLIYPQMHPQMGWILSHMASVKIKKADVLPKGTQLKMLLYLDGNQKAVFKPMRYPRDFIIEGNAWDGYDRHNAEIAAFHLDRVMNFRRAPLVTGRKLDMNAEIAPVAAERLKATFTLEGENQCFYGQCFYCKETEPACGNGSILEGSLTLWFPDNKPLEKIRHPYQRTYKPDKKARWETDEEYCSSYVKKTEPYSKGNRLLDLIDTAIFDFLIGNADRHHYEVFKDVPDGMMLLMDNAKAFGNPDLDELTILAPLRQCCLIRTSTFERLIQLKNGLLTKLLIEAMKSDPIAPVLHKKHIEAINRRMPIIFQHIQACVNRVGKDAVIMDSWKGVESGT